ncbi:MAG TPA: hypothetical protein VLB02_00660 [Candidatus Paceibacterota bacterium]|nr:hypothetical protein [Candidatus Paceibacterota bacterium]
MIEAIKAKPAAERKRIALTVTFTIALVLVIIFFFYLQWQFSKAPAEPGTAWDGFRRLQTSVSETLKK